MLWQIVFCLLGAACLAYYVLIGVSIKRWNSTFARFWPVMGGVWFLLGITQMVLTPGAAALARGGVGILAGVFLIVEAVILTGMRPCRDEALSWIVILGAHVAGVKVTDSLKRRLDRATAYLETHSETRAVVSGGQGTGEDVTEAAAMKAYLIRRGISPERIFCEDQSRNTRENLEFSATYIEDCARPVGIVTNQFHMYRACLYARKAGYQRPQRLCAGCQPVLFVNYMVREGFAVLKLWILG